MIPDKPPALAAIAWITVVMAYAWASNRDYEDAVLVRRSVRPFDSAQAATVGAPPTGRRTEPVPAGLAPGVAERARLPHPTLTGDRK